MVWHPRDASIFRQSDSLEVEEVEGDGQMREPDRQLLARYVLYTHLGLVRGNGGIYDVIKKCQRTSAREQVVSGASTVKNKTNRKMDKKTPAASTLTAPLLAGEMITPESNHTRAHMHTKSAFYSTKNRVWKKLLNKLLKM